MWMVRWYVRVVSCKSQSFLAEFAEVRPPLVVLYIPVSHWMVIVIVSYISLFSKPARKETTLHCIARTARLYDA